MAPSEIERGLSRLEGELKRLEAEYNMFFAGRLPKPPWETRSKVEALIKQFDRTPISNYAERFRFQTLQSRFAAFVELWDRGLRAREEGRSGPFAQSKAAAASEPKRPDDRILHVTAFADPLRELDKLHDLHASLTEARQAIGDDAVPFHRFAELVKTQVEKMRHGHTGEVAFRVALRDGKVTFTARAMKGAGEDNE